MTVASIQSINRKNNLSTISLFSGAMGLDLGLELAGFYTKICVEIDKPCQKTIKQNINKLGKDQLPILSDINELSSEDILYAAKLNRNNVTLVAGGPPCQAFSTAGRRGSINDPRGSLVNRYLNLIMEIRPRFFVFENVRGILSAAVKHRPLAERGVNFSPLESEEELGSLLRMVMLPAFEKLGYEVKFDLVDTADYGVPQNRQRVIFIGSRDYEFGRLGFNNLKDIITPTHSKNSENGLQPWKTLGDALASLNDENPEYQAYSTSRKTVFELVPQGKNWRHLRDEYGIEYLKGVMGGAYKSGGGKVGFWRRLSFDKPSPTLTTSPLQKSTGLCHPIHTRPLSVREYARIQDFPDWWEFVGTTTQKYKQIGNAVPVGLSKAIGEGLLKIINLSEQKNNEQNCLAAR